MSETATAESPPIKASEMLTEVSGAAAWIIMEARKLYKKALANDDLETAVSLPRVEVDAWNTFKNAEQELEKIRDSQEQQAEEAHTG